MFYDGVIYRPPSEGLILQVTVGCRHNQCSFCSMYKGKSFRVKSKDEIEETISEGLSYHRFAEKIFLADGDALTLDTLILLDLLDRLYKSFPKLKRVGIYGGPKDIMAKSPRDLELLKEHGLGIVYLGVESGSPYILEAVHKGVNPEEMILAGQKIVASGLLLSCTVILGLGGKEYSEEHALATAKVISAINPQYLAALTLMLEPAAPLYREIQAKKFIMLSPFESLEELESMIRHLDVTDCVFRSNHASNYLPLRAHLPEQKEKLLQTLGEVIRQKRPELLRPNIWRGL